VNTVVRVHDRSGREVFAVERTYREVVGENHDDEIDGTTIEAVKFTKDGKSVVLSLASGEELVWAIPDQLG
jgi:hypothetical protein